MSWIVDIDGRTFVVDAPKYPFASAVAKEIAEAGGSWLPEGDTACRVVAPDGIVTKHIVSVRRQVYVRPDE